MRDYKDFKNLLLLIDGSSYLYRAYFALPSLTTKKGVPTGAILGVVNMIYKMIKETKTEKIGVVFDSKEKTNRVELYPQYKANRQEMPLDLQMQLPYLREIIKNMGISIIAIPKIEADDIIASLAKLAVKKCFKVLISTSDKDLTQLVDQNITLMNTMTNTAMDAAYVKNRFGVPPDKIVDLLSLTGDKSDNIEGIAKIGPIGAAKLLQKYGSLENIIASSSQIKGIVGENLRANIERLQLNKTLISLNSDLKIEIDIDDLNRKEENNAKLYDLFSQLEFKNLLKKFNKREIKKNEKLTKNYFLISNHQDLEELINKIENVQICAVNFAGEGKNSLGLALAFNELEIFYIPFYNEEESLTKNLDYNFVRKKLKSILENPAIKKVGHNLKSIIKTCKNNNFNLQNIQFDTEIGSYLLDPSMRDYSLENLCAKYLDCDLRDIYDGGLKEIDLNRDNAQEKAIFLTTVNVRLTWLLYQDLYEKFKQFANLSHLFYKTEMKVVEILAQMELHGILVDPDKLKEESLTLSEKIDQIESLAYKLAGIEFNLNSPKQIQEILYNKMGIVPTKCTKKGQPSTSEETLQDLARHYELPFVILQHRTLAKLKSTYTDKLLDQIDPTTERIHTSFNQTNTLTGRLSSSNPNLQNIPIKSEEGRNIRQTFIASQGYLLMSCDYSQIELRLLAHFSQDEKLISAFKNGIDIHQLTASQIFNIPKERVGYDERSRAKTINFAILYGISAFSLSKQLNISNREAKNYIDNYFSEYPKVAEYFKKILEFAQQNNYVETILGRRIPTKMLNKNNGGVRAAINGPLQGSAADIIKIAMIAIDKWITSSKEKIKLVLQVHDELIFEIAENITHQKQQNICNIMANVVDLSIPLTVNHKVGCKWGKWNEI